MCVSSPPGDADRQGCGSSRRIRVSSGLGGEGSERVGDLLGATKEFGASPKQRGSLVTAVTEAGGGRVEERSGSLPWHPSLPVT